MATGRAAKLAWVRAADGCAVIDRDGVITASNPAFRRLVRHGDGPDGVSVLEIFAPSDVTAVLQDADPGQWVPVAGLGDDGFPFLADISVSPAADGAMVMSARGRGPTVGPAADAPVDDELAHALSHDIRGRLGVVSGFLDIVDELCDGAKPDHEAKPDQMRRPLDRAISATRITDVMLERLVRYHRLGDASFRLAPAPLDQVVADAAASIGGDLTCRTGPLPVVLADAALLVECVVELFRNATEFVGDEPPAIDISASTSGRWCEVQITDNGRGIAPESVDDSFGLFRQLRSPDWEGGVGMGLPICRRIADGHGGKLTLISDGESGTTVSLRLALAPVVD